jgi:hypothetical protein
MFLLKSRKIYKIVYILAMESGAPSIIPTFGHTEENNLLLAVPENALTLSNGVYDNQGALHVLKEPSFEYISGAVVYYQRYSLTSCPQVHIALFRDRPKHIQSFRFDLVCSIYDMDHSLHMRRGDAYEITNRKSPTASFEMFQIFRPFRLYQNSQYGFGKHYRL